MPSKNKGFAHDTSVSVDRSQGEIRKLLEKHGATEFVLGHSQSAALVMFEMKARRIKFILPVPTNPNEKQRQVERARWRCLVLAIKAKLECAAIGLTTFEQEFMAHIVMPNGRTVSEEISPMIENSYKNNKMFPLLGPSPGYK